MKILHSADIHLDSPLRGLERYDSAPVQEIRATTRHAFDNLIELAIGEHVSCVLLAGDLYDGDWKDYNTGLYFVNCMHRLQAADIRVFIVAGNHDAASQITRHLKLPDNVTLFSTSKPETVVLEDLGLAVHGQGFARREVTEDLSSAYPAALPHLVNIGILHTCLDGKPGHAPYAPCSVDGLRLKGYQYWALGHVHHREVVSQDPWIVFPGNIQGRHIRETGAKGCTLVSIEEGEIGAVEHRDLDVLRWARCQVDMTNITSIDDSYGLVRDALQQALAEADGRPVAARLIVSGSSPLHALLHADREHWVQECRALGAGLGGAGIWLEKVILDTRQVVAMDELLDRDDALGGLLRAVQNMQLDAERLGHLASEIAPLRQKLPPDLLVGEDPFDPTDPEYLADQLEDIKELLIQRLLKTGGS